MTGYRTRPRADQDLIDHFANIARDKIAPADRFLKVAGESFERLAEMPGIGRAWESKNPRLRGIRVYPLPAPYRSYLVLYLVADDGIVEILTIIHGARDIPAILDEII